MKRHALAYRLRPGVDQEAADTAAAHPWPVGWTGPTQTRLAACTVFQRPGLLLRVLDIDGEDIDGEDIDGEGTDRGNLDRGNLDGRVLDGGVHACLSGLAGSPDVLAAEARLATMLTAERGVTDATDVRALHDQLAATCFAGRVTAPERLPPGSDGTTARAVLVYPVRRGKGPALHQLLTGGRDLPVRADGRTALASTSLFRQGDLVARLVEAAGDIAVGFAHLRATVSRSPSAGRLTELLDDGYDLRTEAGFTRFLSASAMTLVTDHRASASSASTSLPPRPRADQ
jgi:hypothetical protein